MVKNIDMELGEICCVKATNRQVLIDAINARINSGWINAHPGAPYLNLSLGGEQLGHPEYSIDYPTEADVPAHSVPCICGNPDHWMIKYEEEL